MIYHTGKVTGAEAVIDIDNADAAGAGIEHGEQGGHTAERSAVTYAGGNADDRTVRQTADHAGERALHAGNGDDDPGAHNI